MKNYKQLSVYKQDKRVLGSWIPPKINLLSLILFKDLPFFTGVIPIMKNIEPSVRLLPMSLFFYIGI